MEEMHEGLVEAYASGPLLVQKIMRVCYYWLTMETDYIKHVRMCHRCHIYQNRKNVLPQLLHFLAVPWPFST